MARYFIGGANKSFYLFVDWFNYICRKYKDNRLYSIDGRRSFHLTMDRLASYGKFWNKH